MAAREVETLRRLLDLDRDVIRRRTPGLDAGWLDRPMPPATVTLAGMLEHLPYVEQHSLATVLPGRAPGEPWAAAPWDSAPWDSAPWDDPVDGVTGD